MKILSPRPHGFLDYAIVLLFALAPTLFGFVGTPRIVCYVIAAVQLVMSLLTAYPLGIFKVIPFTIHGGVEALMVIALVALPWALGFSHLPVVRNFFLANAGILALVWLTTDYKAGDYAYPRGPSRPSHA